jgi:hypothetical protein
MVLLNTLLFYIVWKIFKINQQALELIKIAEHVQHVSCFNVIGVLQLLNSVSLHLSYKQTLQSHPLCVFLTLVFCFEDFNVSAKTKRRQQERHLMGILTFVDIN